MQTKISSGTIARTIVLALALANQILLMLGIQAIPIEDEAINTIVSTMWTVISAVVAWWKNNSFSKAARIGDEAMQKAKGN